MTKARDLANASTALSAVSATELGYVDGVTSAIQTQIDAKAPSSTAATLSGTQTLTNKTIDTASNTITGAVTLTGTQTLTNKTLTNPVIASVINNTLTSTTGDIIYASAANTPARLGIGSSAQVLTVASGVPSWATPSSGSMTSLASGTFTGTALNITGLSTSYNKLVIYCTAFDPSGGSSRLCCRFNNDATNKYMGSTTYTASAYNFNATFIENLSPLQHSTDSRFAFYWEIQNYATANAYKLGMAQSISTNPSNTADVNINYAATYFKDTAAISQLNFFESLAGTFSLTYQIWGVK